VRIDVSASLGGAPFGDGSTGDVSVQAHSIAHASVTLAPPGSDLSAPPDLTTDDGPLPDLAMPPPPDLTGEDFSLADLTPLPDLTVLSDLACTAGARCPYAYRRRVTITNNAAPLPVGYTVRIPLPALTGKIRADANDLRVFEDAPNQELDRILDSAPPNQTPAVWIALGASINSGSSDNNYWLYYGDPNAVAGPQKGSNVFPFYDDFPGTTLNAQWTPNGAPTVSGGFLTLHQNGADGVRSDYLNDKVPILSAFEARVRVTNPASAGQVTANGTFWYWWGYQHQNDFIESDPWDLFIGRNPNEVHGEVKVNPGNCYPTMCSAATVTIDTNFHWYLIQRQSTQTRYTVDGLAQGAITDNNTGDYSLMLRDYAVTSDVVVDWVRARSLANPEPTVTVGAEEVLH
jgi:hypothetical protein